jgi:secreted trypsin-like serine protease
MVAFAVSSPPVAAIVGGRPAAPGEFGYVADVKIAGSSFSCTGVLIAPQWVLTAGHCGSASGSLSLGLVPSQVAWPPSAYTVQLGTVYSDGRGGERHRVSAVMVDSDYLVSNGVGNDVALLKLSVPTALGPMLIAPDQPWTRRAGVLGTIAGFGTTSESSSTYPPQMRYAQVPFTTDAYCAQQYPNGPEEVQNDGYFDPATMICAGYPQGGTDTCEGDSGGPLLAPAPNRQLLLVATTSFGKGCGEAGHPGVYALVAHGPIRAFIARLVPGAFASPVRTPHRRTRHRHRRTRRRHRDRHRRTRHRRHRASARSRP